MSEPYIIPLNNRKSIPITVYFFLTEINKRLKEKNFNKDKSVDCVATVLSKDIVYNWDAINIVQKHFSKDGWICRMSHFYKSDDRKYNIYTWTFDKKKEKKSIISL